MYLHTIMYHRSPFKTNNIYSHYFTMALHGKSLDWGFESKPLTKPLLCMALLLKLFLNYKKL